MIFGAHPSDQGGARALREIALTGAAVLGAVALVAALSGLAFGLRPLVFRSGSMSPSIGTGALAVARSVPATTLRVGDVVSVHVAPGDDTRVTHRVIAVSRVGETPRATLVLKGDANKNPDPHPYTVAQADRVLFAVPVAGRVVAWLAGPGGMFVMGLYAACLVRLLLRRRPARHRRPDGADVSSAGGARQAGAVALILAGTLAVAVVVPRVQETLAAWGDTVGPAGSTLGTLTVPPPATFTCNGVGLGSVTFSWSAVSNATNYTLHYSAGTKNTTALTTNVSGLVSSGTAWVTADRNFGSTTWTSAASNTRSYTVVAVAVCG